MMYHATCSEQGKSKRKPKIRHFWWSGANLSGISPAERRGAKTTSALRWCLKSTVPVPATSLGGLI
jgi:hypothetical protein